MARGVLWVTAMQPIDREELVTVTGGFAALLGALLQAAPGIISAFKGGGGGGPGAATPQQAGPAQAAPEQAGPPQAMASAAGANPLASFMPMISSIMQLVRIG